MLTAASIAWALLPSVAQASGGGDGYPTLLGLLAVPLLLLLGIGLAIALALKKTHILVGVAGLVLGGLGALWQGFWYKLEHDLSMVVALVGTFTNVAVFLLAVLHLQAGGKRTHGPR